VLRGQLRLFDRELQRFGLEPFRRSILDYAETTLKRNYRRTVPVRTGTLARSLRVRRTEKELYAVVDHPKAAIIELGSRPSRGAYVPKLGRRIRRGSHPGTRPKRFFAETVERTVSQLDRELNLRSR